MKSRCPCEDTSPESWENAQEALLEVRKCESLSCVQIFVTPWTLAHQALLSMEFSRQEHWSGQSFPSPGDLPDPGIELRSPALQVYSLLMSHQRYTSLYSATLSFILSDTLKIHSQAHFPEPCLL